MFDIEKELIILGRKKERPDEMLRQHTIDKLCKQAGPVPRRTRGLRLAAIPAAAALLAVMLLLIVVPGVQATNYFTIDINPSIGIETDSDGIILSVKAQNSDAEDLLADLDLKGMSFIDALRCVVQAAEEQGYLKDNGHVLVAHFGNTTSVSELDIETAVQSTAHSQVNVLLLQSDKDNYRKADGQHQSAGISLLMKNAQRLGIEGSDIDAIIEAVKKTEHTNNSNSSQHGNNLNPSPTATTRPSSSHGNNGGSSNNSSNNNDNTDNNDNDNDNDNNDNNDNSNNGSNNGNNGNDNNGNNGNSGSNSGNGNNSNTAEPDKEDKPGGGGNGD